jgi:uncharacterized membrane protein YqhA
MSGLPRPPQPTARKVERTLETVLWNSRLVFSVATLACLVLAIGLLWISTVDTAHMVSLCLHYADPTLEAAARKATRVEIVGEAVKALDGFLLAMAMLIFAFGIYELFVSDLNEAHSHQLAGRILVIGSLDDLKSRLGKVILVIMVVTLFEGVLEFHPVSALDLLAIGGAILVSAGALYLSHRDRGEGGH